MSEIKRAVFGPLLQLIGRKPKMTVGHELSVFLAFMGRHIDHHERALWLQNPCSFVDCFLRIFQMVKNQKDESDINTRGFEGK